MQIQDVWEGMGTFTDIGDVWVHLVTSQRAVLLLNGYMECTSFSHGTPGLKRELGGVQY